MFSFLGVGGQYPLLSPTQFSFHFSSLSLFALGVVVHDPPPPTRACRQVMGGLDCATALRSWERSINREHRQRICAVSSHTDTKERRTVDAGFDHYQSKPVRGPQILEIASAAQNEPR